MTQDKLTCLPWCKSRVERAGFSRQRHLEHRCFVAHTYAANPLNHDVRPGSMNTILERLKQPIAPLCHTTGAQADVYLWNAVGNQTPFIFRCRRLPIHSAVIMEEALYYAGNPFRGDMTKGALADLYHRSQSATAQACHRLNGKLGICICVFVSGNTQIPAQCIFDTFSSGHVTGGASTNTHNEFTSRLEAKHVVKGRNATDRRRSDLGAITNMDQGLFRKIAIVFLHGLKYRNYRVGCFPDSLDCLLHECQINRFHSFRANFSPEMPMHQIFVCPRKKIRFS